MGAQRRAGIFVTVQPAPLQFWNDRVNEIVERARKVGRHDDEAVGQAFREPLLENICDPGRSAATAGSIARYPCAPRWRKAALHLGCPNECNRMALRVRPGDAIAGAGGS
jgi:hypothetical protein